MASCEFLEKDPTEAFELIDKLTNYDALYEVPFHAPVPCVSVCAVTSVPLEEVAHVEENKELRKEVSSLKACQLCQCSDHVASLCPILKQVLATENRVTT